VGGLPSAAMNQFLAYTFVGSILGGSMIGLLLSGDSLAGALEGLGLGLGVWLALVGWAYFQSSSS